MNGIRHETLARRRARALPAHRDARALRLRDGRLLGYADFGDPEGAPLLALHGTPGSRLVFRLADRPARERRLRLIAPDRPGYGLSSPPDRDGAVLAEDIRQLLDGLGLERVSLLGVSGGAPFAAACAAAFGERAHALALVSPIGLLGAATPLSIQHRLIFQGLGELPWLGALTFQAMRLALARAPDLAYRGMVNRATPSDRAILLRPEVKASVIEALGEGLRGGVEGACADVRLFARAWDFDLAALSAPMRLWQGTADRTVPAAAAFELATRMPGCETVRLEGAGHYWMFDGFGTVLDWLTAAHEARAA